MKNDDMSFVADALLALCERERTAPFYSEHGFEMKLRQANRREANLGAVLQLDAPEALLQRECQEVFARAKLTDRQSDVLTKRLEGFTFEEIGAKGGHTKQGAQSIFVQALKKLGRSFRVYPYTGLSDVYRREVRRGTRPKAFGTMTR